jgi:hypothetical protein
MTDESHDVADIRLPAPIPLLTNDLGHYIHHIFFVLAAIFMRPIQFTPAFLPIPINFSQSKNKKILPVDCNVVRQAAGIISG